MVPFFILMLILNIIRLTQQNVISTVQGTIRGVTHDGYTSYLGIPYATEVDRGRFKKAGIAPFWLGVRESREPQCTPVSRVEDCLSLDIHVPTSSTRHWPVLVWIAGAAGPYNARQIVLQGIIMIVVHHRIGPLGFLCLKEAEVPGNAAAKDVVLALRWVRDNIVAFHGNPSKVVLAGQSLGAAIAEAVTLSPMGHGLYHGVILQSGSALSPWAFNYDGKQRANKLFEMFPEYDNITDLFLNANLDELFAKSNKLNVPYLPLGLCVENTFKHEEVLLSEAPYDLLSNRKFGKVPMIIGYNTDEAYIFTSILTEANVSKRSADTTFLLPLELKFLNEREKKQISRQVQEMYFKNFTVTSLLAYHRDAYFASHVHRSARLHATSQPVYYYQFSYISDQGVQEEPQISKMGAAHSDDLAYLFSGRDLEGDDGTVQRNLIKLWTNFVKHLVPKDSMWDTLDPEHPRVLDIGVEMKMMDYPYIKSSRMWDDIYDKYYYSRNRG